MLNRKILPQTLLLTSLIAQLFHPAFAAAKVFQTEKIFEAEEITPSAPWTTKNANQSGMPNYLVVTPAGVSTPVVLDTPATNASAELSYTLQVERTGEYKIMLRVLTPSTSTNSLYWAMNGEAYNYSEPPTVSNDWQWYTLISKKKLNAGTHTLKLKYREAGFGIDRLLATEQLYFQPTGIGADPSLPVAMPAPTEYSIAKPASLPAHPRLFLRSEHIPMLRAYENDAKYNTNQADYAVMNTAFKRLRKAASDQVGGNLPAFNAGEKEIDYCRRVVHTIHGKALVYLLDGNQTSGNEAISLVANLLNSTQCQTDTRVLGESITASAIVYDWCYSLLSQTQKQLFIQRFLERAGKMEISYPPIKQGALSDHGAEAQLMRDQLSAAIAFFDENPEIYQEVVGRFQKEYIPARNYVYQAQAHHQGSSYGLYRYGWDMFSAWIWQRLGNPAIYSNEQQQVPYQWLYLRRPDGQLMRDGDSYQSVYNGQGKYWTDPMAFMLPASFYQDPALKYEFVKKQLSGLSKFDDLFVVLMHNPQVPSSRAVLPLTKYFADPAGLMVARTGWTERSESTDSDAPEYNSKVAIATMKVGSVQFQGHQHLDAGHFQLYYKGALAIDSGIYEGLTNGSVVEYGSSHDVNYHKRTVAHNAMLVLDPNETFNQRFSNATSNDGGQRFIGFDPLNLNQLLSPSKSYQVASSMQHHIGPSTDRPDYSYLKGDLSKAYSAKIVNYTRSFVFLNLKNDTHPAALIVLDKVKSSDPNFKKTWLLHSVQMPQKNGDTVTIERTQPGVYNGKLINRTIYPSAAEIRVVGGKGQEFAVLNPSTQAYENFPIAPKYSNSVEEAGAWRVEVSPQSAAETDVFLNAMHVMDAGTATPALAMDAVSSAQMAGVKISNRVVLFAKTAADISDTASFTLPNSTGEVRVLVTDLSPGFWRVSVDGAPADVEYEVQAGAGNVYFIAKTGGNFTLTRADTRSLPVPTVISPL